MTPLQLLQNSINEAGLPFDCGIVKSLHPEWPVVISRPDGILVRLDAKGNATPQQITDAEAIVLLADLTESGIDQAAAAEQRLDANAIINPSSRTGLSRLQRAIIEGTRRQLNLLRAQVVDIVTFQIDIPNMPNGSSGLLNPNNSQDIPVANAAFGDLVFAAASYSLQGVEVRGYVHDAGIVRVRILNDTGSALNFPIGVWRLYIVRFDLLPAIEKADIAQFIRDIVGANV